MKVWVYIFVQMLFYNEKQKVSTNNNLFSGESIFGSFSYEGSIL